MFVRLFAGAWVRIWRTVGDYAKSSCSSIYTQRGTYTYTRGGCSVAGSWWCSSSDICWMRRYVLLSFYLTMATHSYFIACRMLFSFCLSVCLCLPASPALPACLFRAISFPTNNTIEFLKFLFFYFFLSVHFDEIKVFRILLVSRAYGFYLHGFILFIFTTCAGNFALKLPT